MLILTFVARSSLLCPSVARMSIGAGSSGSGLVAAGAKGEIVLSPETVQRLARHGMRVLLLRKQGYRHRF